MTGTPADVPILIVGAGSVGLSLASELGWRGVECLTVDRASGLNPHPRANAVASRTMEYYRRWGIDRAIAATGLPNEMPARYLWVTTMFGQIIHGIDLPSAKKVSDEKRGGYARGEQSWSPYLKTTTGQNEVEAVLLDFVRAQPSIDLRFDTELTEFQDQGDRVVCTLTDLKTGRPRTVTCRYLVACDGGRSTVRQALGTKLTGRASLASFISIYFRAPDMIEKGKFGNANIFFPLHRNHRGFLLNWDGIETFTYHLILPDGVDWHSVDPVQAVRTMAGRPHMPVEVISTQPWSAHALTAETYRPSPNIFLAGDAAHLFTPTGGFGMNTGVSDAIDLAWRLQAALEGWAGPKLLESYDIERRPIGIRNTSEAAHCFDELFSVMQNADEIEDQSPDGAALRADLGRRIKDQEKLIVSSGTLLGYRYEGSPIIVPDGTPPTDDHPRHYEPIARPGHRAPHIWLEDGSALMDRFGQGYTLLVCPNASPRDVRSFERAASDIGVPLCVAQVEDRDVRITYGANLVLIRPDLMIAWRGDDAAESAAQLLKQVAGWPFREDT